MNQPWLLKAENISKSFPGVKALDKVTLTIEGGKVHTIIGENGAGKSTLMKILMGMLSPDEGAIFYKDEKVKFTSVNEAIKTGLSMIHQELLPFPELSIAENIFMGKEPTLSIPGWINTKEMNKNAVAMMIYKPNSKLIGESTAYAQQIDLYPTILDLIGYPCFIPISNHSFYK